MIRRATRFLALPLLVALLAACGGPAGGPTPGPPQGGGSAAQVSAGSFHSLARTTDGRAFAWGWNFQGGLGVGDGADRATAAAVAAPAGTRFAQVAGGGLHSVAVTDDGRVYAWGRNTSGAVGDGVPGDRLSPTAIAMPGAAPVAAVAAGGDFSLALTDDGRLFAWGANGARQLGDGTTTTRTTPVVVQFLGDVRFVDVDAGGSHALALGDDGHVYAWGNNNEGQLGDGTTNPRSLPQAVALPGDPTVVAIAAGTEFSLVLTDDGTAYAWGLNLEGRLGDGTTEDRLLPVAVALPDGPSFVDVAAGSGHALALASDGALYAWGLNDVGQLGDGTTSARSLPGPVAAPAGTSFAAVDAGGSHVLALTEGGALLAWGWNARGQLGDGSSDDRSTPGPVALPTAP